MVVSLADLRLVRCRMRRWKRCEMTCVRPGRAIDVGIWEITYKVEVDKSVLMIKSNPSCSCLILVDCSIGCYDVN